MPRIYISMKALFNSSLSLIGRILRLSSRFPSIYSLYHISSLSVSRTVNTMGCHSHNQGTNQLTFCQSKGILSGGADLIGRALKKYQAFPEVRHKKYDRIYRKDFQLKAILGQQLIRQWGLDLTCTRKSIMQQLEGSCK